MQINPEEIASFLEQYDFDTLMETSIDEVPSGIDTRQGSIIYDALAPANYRLASLYMELKNIMLDSFMLTAQGEYLDIRAQEHGVTRFGSTHAIRRGYFENSDGEPFENLEAGTRFASIGENDVYFAVTEPLDSPGEYELEAEEPGAEGNSYYGQLLPVTSITGLGTSEINDVLVPGRSTESDEDLRTRLFTHLKTTSFAGNWQAYVDAALGITGVGRVQVYPIWNGGGTIKLSILDSDLNIPSDAFIDSIKEEIDPAVNSGMGYGLAPIGHQVTVVKPIERTVDVSMHVDVLVNHSIDSLKPVIISAIENYFLELRRVWGNANALNEYSQTVYRSQVIAAVMQVEGVANVADLKLNGSENDIDLVINGTTQQVVFMGNVSI